MAYCPQCGSKVAENVAFCPYCGFSLQQTTAADMKGKPIFDDAAQISPTENKSKDEKKSLFNEMSEANFEEISVNAEDGETVKRADSAAQAAKDFYGNKNASAAQIARENYLSASTPENTGTQKPDGAAKSSGREGNDLIEEIESKNLDEPGEEIESATTESEAKGEEPIFVPSEEEKNHPSHVQTESELMSYEEAEVKEILTIEDSPDQSNDAREESSIEKPISKPATELEPAENDCPPPKYDSVRIMQSPDSKEKGKSRIDIAENLPSDKAANSYSPLETQISRAAEKRQSDAGRSFTTPNIAGSETDGKKSAKLKPLGEGTILNGRYEIVRKIGGGGMGAVYLASDKNLGGVLRAVKEMVQSYIEDAQQDKAINDFKRESLLLTSLEHQSIPTIYDYFFDEKEARFYLVMKYISGGDLSSRLRSAPEGRIEESIVTDWAIQIADVLDYLHNRQPAIIYRDLKPANIMIDGNSSRVMLIDFGIARWVNKEEKGVTAVGTMGYAPPELFSGNVEPRSDIYSLGSTLFHLLTGADPQSNPLLIFDFQKHPRPRQINPQISDQMEKILMRAVEYNADKRFSSAAELHGALETHARNLKAGNVTFGIKETPSPVAFADQPVFCGFCGQKIVATDMFCAFCGAKQPLAQKGVQSQNSSATHRTAQLLIIGTNELEPPTFHLEKDENLVGRRDPMSNIFPEIDLSKFDPQTKISRKHARIWREGTNFLVEDLGSSNGTIVLPTVKENVRLLPHQPFTLNNGDKIKLGDTTLHFVVAG